MKAEMEAELEKEVDEYGRELDENGAMIRQIRRGHWR